MVTVIVANANGRKCEVTITWRGYTHSSGWTDTNGRIDFDVSGGTGSIHVDGQELVKDQEIYGTVRVAKR